MKIIVSGTGIAGMSAALAAANAGHDVTLFGDENVILAHAAISP